MNRGKRDRPYHYPKSFMQIAVYTMFYFRLPYRQTEGLLRSYGHLPLVPDYTSIHKRVFGMVSNLGGCSAGRYGSITLAINSTGIVINRGD